MVLSKVDKRCGFIFPGKLTDLVKHLFLFFLLFSTVFGEDVERDTEDDWTCETLKTVWMKDGFLGRSERLEYCALNCDFFGRRCVKEETMSLPTVNLTSYFEYINTFAMNALNDTYEGFYERPLYEPPKKVRDAWFELFVHILPLLGCCVPILLNQWKLYKPWGATLLIAIQCGLSFMQVMPVSMALHNALFCFLSAMSSANSAHLFESIGSLGVIQLVFFAMFLNNHYWQVIILMASIVGFFAYLNHVFL
jgi:hypothetical protein